MPMLLLCIPILYIFAEKILVGIVFANVGKLTPFDILFLLYIHLALGDAFVSEIQSNFV